MKKIITDISKLYALTNEMNTIVSRLKTAQVEVRMGQESNRNDPLGEGRCVIRITLNPGCERLV